MNRRLIKFSSETEIEFANCNKLRNVIGYYLTKVCGKNVFNAKSVVPLSIKSTSSYMTIFNDTLNEKIVYVFFIVFSRRQIFI